MTTHMHCTKDIFDEFDDLPGPEIRLMHDRGPSNIQLSSSRDFTSLLSLAIKSDLRTAKVSQVFLTLFC